MRLLFLGLANLLILIWNLLGLPIRAWQARKRPPYVRFKISGDLPYRGVLRPPRRWRRRSHGVGEVESIQQFAEQLKFLGNDPQLKGILLVVEGLALSPAKLTALHGLLAAFRASGKTVVGWAVAAGNPEYELLCAADQILFPKAGRLELTGYAAESMALGGGLRQLGVDAEFIRRGEYKTAPELFTHSDISDAQRETIGRLLDERYASLKARVAAGRRISESEAASKIDHGPYSARRALAEGLCDGLVEDLDLADHLLPGMSKQLGPKQTGAVSYHDAAQLHAWPPGTFLRRRRRTRLAVVTLEGLIAPGSGGGVPGFRAAAGSDTVTEALRSVGRDRRFPAVLLYINSPGGSALASEMILEEVRRVAQKKPVVVYVDRIAASGGYMAALGGHEIWVDPLSIIGSIGVFAGKFNLSGLLEKLGVRRTVITRGEQAGRFSFSRPFTPEERASLESDISETYQVFLEEVARARKQTVEVVHSHAEGRVFSGRRSLEAGLVDRLGSFEDAAKRALELAKVPDRPFDLWVQRPKRNRFSLGQLLEQVSEQLEQAEQPRLYALWAPGWSLSGFARSWLTALLVFMAGCATTQKNGVAVESYRAALKKGDLPGAYALTSPQFRKTTPREVFERSLGGAEARQVKLDAIDSALARLGRAAPELGLPGGETGESAEHVAGRFIDAALRGDFAEGYRLLGRQWRARYTPERLAADFAREPRARDRLQRARAALAAGPEILGETAVFPVGSGGAMILLKEEDGYRIAALE